MSQALTRLADPERGGDTADVRRNPPQSTGFGDSSRPLLSIYSKVTEGVDNRATERCQKDAESVLVFTGLFSAVVGGLLTVSVQDLKPNPQDTSTVYLASIYQLLADSNVTHAFIPPTSPQFSPPRYAVWANALWFLSLFVALTGALMATSQQDWARRYIKIIRHPRYSPENQARIRAFLANGFHKSHLLTGGDGLIVYVHLAIFLFVVGAAIYLYNINHTIFIVVAVWIGYSAIAYLFFTLLPIFVPDIFMCTPLSSIVLQLSLRISFVVMGIFSYSTRCHRLRDGIKMRYQIGFMSGKFREIKATASKPSSKIDALVLEEIFFSLDGDSALEKFIDTIPGFCNSPLVCAGFPPSLQEKLQLALYRLLDQTFSFSSVSDSVRSCRLISCLNAAHAALPPNVTLQIFDDIFDGRWTEALQSVEIGHSLRRWGLLKDNLIGPKVRRIIACIVACTRGRDERWITLVEDEFGVQGRVLRDYVAHGNSPLLAVLIHVIRQSLAGNHHLQQEVLRSLSKFDMIDTLPGLQDNFCALWNELVQEARDRVDPSFPIEILREIRHLYIALHQGTDSDAVPIDEPAFNSYPFCNISGHHRYQTASTHTGGPSASTSRTEIPSWRIQLGDSPDPSFPQRFVLVDTSSRPGPLDSQYLPATPQNIIGLAGIHLFSTTTNQQVEYANVMPEPECLSSPDVEIIPSAIPPMPEFPSPWLTTHLAHPPSQVTPTAYPTIPVNPGAFIHPDVVATPTRVPTGPDLPSSPIPNSVHTTNHARPTNESSLADVPNAPRYITSGVRSPRTEQQDMATQGAAQGPRETTFMVNHVSHSIPDDGTTRQRNAEIAVINHVSDSTSSPTLMSAPRTNMILPELPSSVETSPRQIDTSGELRLSSPSSSPTTAHSHLCLRCTLIMDTDIPSSVGATSAHHALDPHSPRSNKAHQPEPASTVID